MRQILATELSIPARPLRPPSRAPAHVRQILRSVEARLLQPREARPSRYTLGRDEPLPWMSSFGLKDGLNSTYGPRAGNAYSALGHQHQSRTAPKYFHRGPWRGHVRIPSTAAAWNFLPSLLFGTGYTRWRDHGNLCRIGIAVFPPRQ